MFRSSGRAAIAGGTKFEGCKSHYCGQKKVITGLFDKTRMRLEGISVVMDLFGGKPGQQLTGQPGSLGVGRQRKQLPILIDTATWYTEVLQVQVQNSKRTCKCSSKGKDSPPRYLAESREPACRCWFADIRSKEGPEGAG